jgi:hypothetical protein
MVRRFTRQGMKDSSFRLHQAVELFNCQPGLVENFAQSAFSNFLVIWYGKSAMGRTFVSEDNVTACLVVKGVAYFLQNFAKFLS